MSSFRHLMIFASVGFAGAVLVCACSVIYGNYNDRFSQTTSGAPSDASTPFFESENAIIDLTVAAGNVFIATGNQILRVSEDGGAATVWWSGDAGAGQIVKLASNGSDTLMWTFGSSTNSMNDIFVSSSASSNGVSPVANGAAYGGLLAAAAYQTWSLNAPAKNCSPCTVAELRAPDGAQTPLNFAGSPTVTGAHALAIDQSGVDGLISPGRFLRFDLAGNSVCTSVGFTPTTAAIATGRNGTPTFLVDGPNTGSGTLTRFDTDCPSADGGGVMLAPDVGQLVGDESSVYWSTSTGEILSAKFTENDAGRLGSANAATTALAIGTASVYAAVGSKVLRFPKTP